MEETRGHLADAVEAGRARGLSSEEAESEAVARYGDTRALAAKLAAGKNRTLHWVLLGVAITMGLAIAWVDSRPHWDDTGITAGSLLLSAGLLGLIGPRRPWLWALGIGMWVPAWMPLRIFAQTHAIVVDPLLACVTLGIAMAGSYGGMALRRAIDVVSGSRPSA